MNNSDQSAEAAPDDNSLDLAQQKAASRRRDWEDIAAGRRTPEQVHRDNTRCFFGETRGMVILNLHEAMDNLCPEKLVPRTTPQAYLSGETALTLPALEGTRGDWHPLPGPMEPEAKFFLAGEHADAFVNTNPLLGEDGIYDCTGILEGLGYSMLPGEAAFAANHYRATCDRLVWQVREGYQELNFLRPRDFFDTDAQLAKLGRWVDRLIGRAELPDSADTFLHNWRIAHRF